MTSSNVHLLEQAVSLLTAIDDSLYSGAPIGIAKSGVGGHLRHCLDFYECFLRGAGEGKTGRIDYDHRERNELIEKDRLAAKAKVTWVISQLRALTAADLRQTLLVKSEGEQPQAASAWSQSSASRELQFLLSHTVHHFALIAMLLRVQGFEPAADFGIAASTLQYWQAKA